MTIKRLSWLMFTLLLVTLSAVQAQERHDIELDRATIQSERQSIVAANLPMSEEQAKAFWPMFREYRAEMAKLGDRAVNLVLDYAKNLETLSDAQATAMLDEYLAIQKDESKIKSAWVPKFRKILPSTAVTRFYQIENKLDAIIRIAAAEEIPLVETPKK